MNRPIPIRKLLTILAAVCLLLVCLAGCNKAASGDPTDATDPPAVQTDPGNSATPTDAPDQTTEPQETEAPAQMGTVTADGLNVRSNPSIDGSTVLNQLAINTRVIILEQKIVGDVTWGRIAEGWINMNYVLLDGEDPTPPTEAPEQPDVPEVGSGSTGIITASELNIRESNSTDAKSVGKYKKGDKVEILETKDGWGRTNKGWISLKYVKLDDSTETPEINDNKDDKETSTLVTDGKTTILGYVFIDAEALNVRYGPSKDYDVVTKVHDGDKVAYYQEKNGWIRIKDGWISKSFTMTEDEAKKESMVSDKNTKVLGYAVVTSDELNVRLGPGTNHETCDKFNTGKRVAYYQKDGNWIRTEDGWISSKYTYMEGEKGDGAGKGTITGDQLNVRTGPGTDYKSTGKLNKGDTVEILAQVKVGKTTWGYTSKGWISMDYVKMN